MREPELGLAWEEGHRQPSLPTTFLRLGTQAGALPKGFLVIAGTAPAPVLPTSDTAHSRDAAGAVGHIATTDCAGPEAIATTAAGAANDGCREGVRVNSHSERAGRFSVLRDRPGSPWAEHPKGTFPDALPLTYLAYT